MPGLQLHSTISLETACTLQEVNIRLPRICIVCVHIGRAHMFLVAGYHTITLQVPSCCVLTNLGLSTLPGSRPGGSTHTSAVSQLVSDLQAGAASYSFWGNQLSVRLRDDSSIQAGWYQRGMHSLDTEQMLLTVLI